MPNDAPRWLSTAETAAALGVTPRALRLYERRGLVRPQRTEAGWRAYGPEALARLHQIVALKGMGLSLARIGELLDGRLRGLDAVLALQEQAIRARKAEAERALSLLAAARARLGAGQTLSLDDLTALTKETTMHKPMTEDEWRAIFDPITAKHYTPEQLETLRARKSALVGGDHDVEQANEQWGALITEAKQLHDPSRPNRGDPTTPAAMDLAGRWMAMVERFDGGDPDIRARSRAMWTEVLGDPEKSAKLPFDLTVWTFVRDANKARLEERAR